jgi:hypothetical protein
LLKWAREGGWNIPTCLGFLHAFLTKVQTELDKLPEGTILVADQCASYRQFTFKTIQATDINGQNEWAVLTNDFKVLI